MSIMVRKLLVRHGLSEANNRHNRGTAAFGAPDAPLMLEGTWQARNLSIHPLLARFALSTSVATSTLVRTQETGLYAGFTHQVPYPELDEVTMDELGNISRQELGYFLHETHSLPPGSIEASDSFFAHIPDEPIIFSHGLKIASICARLGQHQDERLIPRFCEVREVEL